MFRDHQPRVAVAGTTSLTEEQTLVFVEAHKTGAPARVPRTPPAGPDWIQSVAPTTVQLFRYSALTFNGHRIHYDRSYCSDVEGYPGLIVHGPLVATLLAEQAVRYLGSGIVDFSFRAVAPLFDTAPFTINGRKVDSGAELWAERTDGSLAMIAAAGW